MGLFSKHNILLWAHKARINHGIEKYHNRCVATIFETQGLQALLLVNRHETPMPIYK